MKKIVKFIGITLVVLGFAFNAAAQVSDGAYAEAHIITPLTIEKSVDMDFGNIAVINSPGHVFLSTASVRTSDGGATPVANPTGIVTAAEFDITGTPNAQVFVTLPASPPGIDVIHTNGTDLMNVNTFICTPASGFLIPAGGLETIFVGATLNTDADQLPGTYHTLTDFIVMINYQ
ncbi:MAG: DUF4402 domain-containing protein [Bacteroidetes bacterium]|nr:DUF4402 domain-containing protein [Bacteroidota bacterium]